MKRKLLKQIGNEWKSNIWLAVELLIVSVVVYFLASFLWMKTELMLQPLGMETDNCFKIELSYVSHDSPSHEAADSTDATGAENIKTLFDRVRNLPQVENAALAYYAVPYEMSFMGRSFSSVNLADTIMTTGANMLYVSPDYVKIFRMGGTHGETPEELAALLADGKILVSQYMRFFSLSDYRSIDRKDWKEWERITKFVSGDSLKNVVFSSESPWSEDDGNRYIVGASIFPIKRMEFEAPGQNTVIPFDMNNDSKVCESSILVRVRPEARETFRDDILSHSNDLFRSGNRFFSNVTELSKIKQRTQSQEYDTISYFLIIIAFLLICIFLGLLGTFWFRTQQRVSEIAVRKVNGATSGQIFRRLIGEGILLLAIVTPVAVLLDWLVSKTLLTENPEFIADTTTTFIAAVAITFCLLAAMIALGIWFPATRAMKIDPALALKDE